MEYFVARQPIFDRDGDAIAYEILFRSSMANFYEHGDGDEATASVLNQTYMSIGIANLTGGKRAFINFTESLLHKGVVTLFPRESIGVEILETVEPSDEILAICKKLKAQGYLLVLDDFVLKPGMECLLEVASLVKVDFLSTSPADRADLIRRYRSKDLLFLAEKVESFPEHEEAMDLGYDYFQGYYFTKPVVVSTTEARIDELNQLRLLQIVNEPELNFDTLENIIKQDLALSYKLLRYVNSAFFSLPCQIKSIRHALTMLGINESRRWISFITLVRLGEERSAELTKMSLFRAILCERLASTLGLEDKAPEFFLMGLMSLINAILQQEMPRVLKHLPLSDEIKAALLGETGSQYSLVLKTVVAYERGDWKKLFKYLEGKKRQATDMTEWFVKVVEQADHILAA